MELENFTLTLFPQEERVDPGYEDLGPRHIHSYQSQTSSGSDE